MLRVRFKASFEDYRPIKWPPSGPYWCTGWDFDETYSIVVAYVDEESQVTEFWPEAEEIDFHAKEDPVFTDRFPKPDWWPFESQKQTPPDPG